MSHLIRHQIHPEKKKKGLKPILELHYLHGNMACVNCLFFYNNIISKGKLNPKIQYLGTASMMDLHLPLAYHTMGISLLELSR